MTKPTKDQKYNKKRREDGKANFRKTFRDDGKTGVRVTRRALSVSISLKAFEKLVDLAEKEGIARWEMLTRMLIVSIPANYKHYNDHSIHRYKWEQELINPKDRTFKYKGTTGEKQITYDITSTAWNKLECHKTAIGLSKARIVQSIILHYTPTTQIQREREKQWRLENKERYAEWNNIITTNKDFKGHFRSIGGGMYEHIKGIPAEQWTEEEVDEFHKLMGSLE